jgi:3-hydroxy-3-methylglutaryl CoA synthase
MVEYTTDIKFHHVHITISLDKSNQVANRSSEKVKAYAKNFDQESMIHYHKDNQYADNKRSVGYAKLITDQNIFVTMNQQNPLSIFKRIFKS